MIDILSSNGMCCMYAMEFRPSDLMKVAGLTHRQVQYWDDTGLLGSSGVKQRRFSLFDLALATIISNLREFVSIQKIRELLPKIRPLLNPDTLLTTSVLFLPPGDFIVVEGEVRACLADIRNRVRVLEIGRQLGESLPELIS